MYTLNPSIPKHSEKLISNGMLGMIFFLAFEVMLFAALISAYIVNKANAIAWQPANQPRLPVEVTAVNTLFLLASAITILLFSRNYSRNKSLLFLYATMSLGVLFVCIQGMEWAKLIGFGLTTTSSISGAFFYMIIGAHALHVIAGIAILFYVYWKLQNQANDSRDKIAIGSLYWYFVVGIWPVLYILVYL